MDPQKTFSNVRNNIIDLVRKNQHREITAQTDFTFGGVYLLYADDFSDDRILPIYIGQTNNFQIRHKEHLTKLMAINRLTSDRHLNAILKDYHHGKYFYCKLFQYLVDHDLTFKNLHMLIIDEVPDKNDRDKCESSMIERHFASFFGFNQFYSFTESVNRQDSTQYLSSANWTAIAVKDMANALTFLDYGYTLFNCLITSNFYRPRVDFPVQETPSYKHILAQQAQAQQLNEQLWNYNKSTADCYKQLEDIIQPFFTEYNLKSSGQKSALARDLAHGATAISKEFVKYIRRTKKDVPDFFQWLSLQNDITADLLALQQTVAANEPVIQSLSFEVRYVLHSLCSSLGLFPRRDYATFPLRDRYTPVQTADIPPDICLFRIDYSCLKTLPDQEIYPTPLCISVLLKKQGHIINRAYFLHTCLDDFFENESKYYFIFFDIYSINSSDPTNIRIAACDTKISLTSEYQTGINEYTLSRFPKYDLFDVFSELNELVDSSQIIVTVNGPKKDFIDFQQIPALKDNLFVKRVCCIANKRKDPLMKK